MNSRITLIMLVALLSGCSMMRPSNNLTQLQSYYSEMDRKNAQEAERDVPQRKNCRVFTNNNRNYSVQCQ